VPKDTFLNLPEEKQEKIMRSSIHEFINNGFEKGNVGNIAKNSQVAKGSMYQYFDNKKELFLYTVQWGIGYLLKRFAVRLTPEDDINIFEFFYQNSKDIMVQMRQERELVIFIQNVFLGRYHTLTDESMAYVNKMSEDYILKLIAAGKLNGTIRNDMDDHILSLIL
jgi:AcrR family transcriptional regulator